MWDGRGRRGKEAEPIMNLRKDDMGHWSIRTWRYDSLAQAMEHAEHQLHPAARVFIWPLATIWMVVVQTSAVVN